MSITGGHPIHRRTVRVPAASLILACHVVILVALFAPALTPLRPAMLPGASTGSQPNLSLVKRSSESVRDSGSRDCEDRIPARVAGAVGLAVIGLGLHILLTSGALLLERLDMLRHKWLRTGPEACGESPGYPTIAVRAPVRRPSLLSPQHRAALSTSLSTYVTRPAPEGGAPGSRSCPCSLASSSS